MFISLPDGGVNTTVSENDPVAALANPTLTSLLAKYPSHGPLLQAQALLTSTKKVHGVDPFGRTGTTVPKPG